MSKGVIYIATSPIYLREAEISAMQLKETNPNLSVSIITPHDPKIEFEHVIDVRQPRHNMSDKIRNYVNSPYDKTLFLDTDTVILDSVEEGFKLLDKFDLAFALDPEHGEHQEQVPDSFPQANNGVLFYKNNSKFRKFCEEWLKEFEKTKDQFETQEQPQFRKILWEHDIRFCVLRPEWNLLLDFPTVADGRVRIAHSRILKSIDKDRYVNIMKFKTKLQENTNPRLIRPRTGRSFEIIHVKPPRVKSKTRVLFHIKNNGFVYLIKRIWDEILG